MFPDNHLLKGAPLTATAQHESVWRGRIQTIQAPTTRATLKNKKLLRNFGRVDTSAPHLDVDVVFPMLLPSVPSNFPVCSLLITLLTLSRVALGKNRYKASRKNSAWNAQSCCNRQRHGSLPKRACATHSARRGISSSGKPKSNGSSCRNIRQCERPVSPLHTHSFRVPIPCARWGCGVTFMPDEQWQRIRNGQAGTVFQARQRSNTSCNLVFRQ